MTTGRSTPPAAARDSSPAPPPPPPDLIGAQLLLGSRGELEARLEAERAVLTAHQPERQVHLLDHLVVAADDVTVILGQLPYAEHAGQRAGALVAEEPAVVGQPHRPGATRTQ